VPRPRSKPIVAVGEILMWILFVALLVPAGAVGWAIGHYTGHHGGRTVTVTVGAAATTTTTAAAPTTTAKAATTTAAAAPIAAAKAVFISAGCGACHTFKAAGTSGKVGPDLDTAPEADAKKANMPLAAFVKQSIVDPNAYIAPGFSKGIMPGNFSSTLGTAKIDALVAFIAAK
jgi:cytochrome c551/c552